jgi:uncharacterized protein YdeI (YjbR/CyaY-like superfamily)
MPKPPLQIPAELEAALAMHLAARKHFSELAPSCQREYVKWIAEAKRTETREKRSAKAVVMLSAGLKLHEKWTPSAE